jgi:endoglucanase
VGRSMRISGTAALVCAALAAGGMGGVAAAADEPPEQIVNGGFDDGGVGWTNYPSPSYPDGTGCIDVPAGSGPYSAAISQKDVAILGGQAYDLTFRASATAGVASVNVRVTVQRPEPPYDQALPEKALSASLTPELAAFAYNFTAPADIPNGELVFQQTGTNAEAYRLCVDDVSLRGGEAQEYEPDTGPRVRVNQVAYLPAGPKGATVVTAAADALPWVLRDAAGAVVATGATTPRGENPSSGLTVHTVDFTSVTATGEGFTLEADGETSRPFAISAAPYERLRVDSKAFFYANRSGVPISAEVLPGYGRAAGHIGVAPNQGDTAVGCQEAGDDSQKLLDEPFTCDYTRDVSGGWYDAGDHGKYVVNGGIAVAQLMQEFERTKNAGTHDLGALGDSTLRVPERGNGVPDLLDEARHELEWLLKMQVPAGEQYAGMAFHKVADVDWTGLPLAPADDPQKRVLYRPSTAATLNLAAAAAQGSRLFAPYDAAFAARLLTASRTAYAAAKATPALHAPAPDPALDPNPGSGPYNDSDVSDEFYWAAAELWLTTAEPAFRADVTSSPVHTADVFLDKGFSWGSVAALGRLDLATVPNELPDRDRVRASVLAGADTYLAQQATEAFGQPYAPSDGDYVWGSNGQILNNLQVIGTAYDLSGDERYRRSALTGIDYVLGRNALNISYVTGYGTVFAQHQHSRMYSRPPAGTVAGGPNSTAASTGDPVAAPIFAGCEAQFCYIDDVGSWSTNEITINWNSGLSWVSSWLADQDDATAVPTATCEVRYATHGAWPGSSIAQVWLKNTGRTPITGWNLTWSYTGAQSVRESWGATTATSGATVTARNEPWNRVVAPGRTATFGLIESHPSGASPAPETIWLNGRPCARG